MRLISTIIILGATFTSCVNSNQQVHPEEPNVLLVVLDDMGFSDLGCYGGEISTPTIDKLGFEGIRFTQFYNAGRCCPSRASILTGRYPHNAGIGHMTQDLGFPGYSGELDRSSETIGEVLKENDYFTFMAGKWHVTKDALSGSDKTNWPLQRGFDRFFGTIPGHGSFFDPKGLVEGNEFITAEGDFYYTEKIGEYSRQYIQESVQSGAQFFGYLAFSAPHYPLHARKEQIELNRGLYAKGWDSLRLERYNKLIELNILDPAWKLSDRDEQSIPFELDPNRHWQQERMEVYAAMISHVDNELGEIVQLLKDLDAYENTLIILLSDNGGSAEGHLNGTIERWGTPWKSSLIPDTTRSGILVKAGDFPGVPLGGDSTYGSYGVKWSNLSNTPFYEHKSWLHEGGIATPMIMHFPGIGTKLLRQPSHIIDILPSIIDFTNSETTHKVDGISLLSGLQDIVLPERDLFWEHEGNRAIRSGDWKLVSKFPGTWSTVREYPKNGDWELYNMKDDRTENNDIADSNPDIVKRLDQKWKEWAEKNNVKDWSTIKPAESY